MALQWELLLLLLLLVVVVSLPTQPLMKPLRPDPVLKVSVTLTIQGLLSVQGLMPVVPRLRQGLSPQEAPRQAHFGQRQVAHPAQRLAPLDQARARR